MQAFVTATISFPHKNYKLNVLNWPLLGPLAADQAWEPMPASLMFVDKQ